MFKKIFQSFNIIFLFFTFHLLSFDFNKHTQKFVLENKKITIPGYPHAYNPSIIRWNNMLIMSFRISKGWDSKIGIVRLNQNFSVIGKPQFLDTRTQFPDVPSRSEDARLFTIGDKMYVIFNDNLEEKNDASRRMFIAEITYDDGIFSCSQMEGFFDYEGNERSWEKNWIPFEYEGKILLSYSINPHTVFLPFLGKGLCETLCTTKIQSPWTWRELRGGTPALLVDDKYLAFFHTSKGLKSKQSGNKFAIHYVFGAYTFSSKPPFNITGISPEPISGKQLFKGNKKRYKIVVYPGGYIFDEKYIWVFYGKDDDEIWVLKLDKNGLLKSLIQVKE